MPKREASPSAVRSMCRRKIPGAGRPSGGSALVGSRALEVVYRGSAPDCGSMLASRDDRFHFDQEFFLDQPIDDKERVWRKHVAGEQFRKKGRPAAHEPANILRMDKVRRELDHVREPAVDAFENIAEIV